jgi:transcriptional regulator GlxA family with amidase domain
MYLRHTCFILVNIFLSAWAFSQKNDSLAKRHQQKMDIIMTKPSIPIKTIGILLYDGYQTLDAMGPYETLSQLGGSVIVFFVGKQKGFIRNQRGMKVQVDTTIAEVSHLDILVIPGGAAETYLLTTDTSVLNWIRKIDKSSVYTTSVCTGAWILGATGLINGKNATTNWYRAGEMLAKYGAHFQERRWVKDGKYWTSAGVTAGIDMSLAIINELMGESFTQAVMLNLEYDPHPPIKGGAVKNTAPIVKEMMEEMYDMGIQPLIQQQQLKK